MQETDVLVEIAEALHRINRGLSDIQQRLTVVEQALGIGSGVTPTRLYETRMR